jgi:hypothetical protein
MKWRKERGLPAIANTPAKARFRSGHDVAGDTFAHGTVEKLHSRAKTPKGPTVVGPFDFRYFMVAGAGFEPATFGL